MGSRLFRGPRHRHRFTNCLHPLGPHANTQSAAHPCDGTEHIPFYNVYWSDSWHMKPSFTLTYGLGWTLEMPPIEARASKLSWSTSPVSNSTCNTYLTTAKPLLSNWPSLQSRSRLCPGRQHRWRPEISLFALLRFLQPARRGSLEPEHHRWFPRQSLRRKQVRRPRRL